MVGGDAQVHVSQPPHQVKWFDRRLLLCQLQRIRLHLRADRRADVLAARKYRSAGKRSPIPWCGLWKL